QDDGTGIDLVLVGVLRRRAVRCLEHGVARHIINVAAGRNADPADLRGQRVGQVISIQIRRRDDVEFVRPGEHLLQRDIRNRILYYEAGAGPPIRDAAPRPAVHFHRAVEVLRNLITPVAEGALGELHDVALVHQRDAPSLVLDGVADGAVDQALGPEAADWFQPDADLDAH